MPQKQMHIDGLGDVTLVRRKGARNLRISLRGDGKIRVSMPLWTPYQAGVLFAKSHVEWANKHQSKISKIIIADGQKIGKAHSLRFVAGSPIRSLVTKTTIKVTTPYDFADERSQSKARKACELALKKEAEVLLPHRLRQLAKMHGYKFSAVKVRKMTSRWGSCSSKHVITLSTYLMQLPWELIDYVLLHELVHTKYLNHSHEFWTTLDGMVPGAKQKQKQIRTHRPRVEPWNAQELQLPTG